MSSVSKPKIDPRTGTESLAAVFYGKTEIKPSPASRRTSHTFCLCLCLRFGFVSTCWWKKEQRNCRFHFHLFAWIYEHSLFHCFYFSQKIEKKKQGKSRARWVGYLVSLRRRTDEFQMWITHAHRIDHTHMMHSGTHVSLSPFLWHMMYYYNGRAVYIYLIWHVWPVSFSSFCV